MINFCKFLLNRMISAAFRSKFALFTLGVCALSAGFLFLTGSHVPKYLIFVLCLLTFIFNKQENKSANSCLFRSGLEFFIPWFPLLLSTAILVVFFQGIPASQDIFNAFLLMIFIFGAFCTKHYSRNLILTCLAIALFVASLCIDIQILLNGLHNEVIGTNKNKVLTLTSVLTVCCLGALFSEGQSLDKKTKWLIGISVLVSISAIILAQVRTGILPFLAVVPFICYFNRKNKTAISVTVVLAVVLLSLSFLTGRMQQGFVDLQKYSAGNSVSSWGIRLELWEFALRGFEGAPFFGWGSDPYAAMTNAGYVLGIKIEKLYHFHNDFINMLATGGLFGVLGWLSTVALLAKKSLKDPASLCLLVGSLAVGLTEQFWFNRTTLFSLVTIWTLLYVSRSGAESRSVSNQ